MRAWSITMEHLSVLVSPRVLAVAIVVDLVAPVAAADEPGSFDDLWHRAAGACARKEA